MSGLIQHHNSDLDLLINYSPVNAANGPSMIVVTDVGLDDEEEFQEVVFDIDKALENAELTRKAQEAHLELQKKQEELMKLAE